MHLTPREAETLSYIMGRCPVYTTGELIFSPLKDMREDLNIERSHLAQVRWSLLRKGFIRMYGSDHYYVLKRVDDKGVTIRNHVWAAGGRGCTAEHFAAM